MYRSNPDPPADTAVPGLPDAKITVSDFGPIGTCSIDLRPLTIFVGPSNAGKTYLAVLIYALNRSLEGFHRTPFTLWNVDPEVISDSECADISKKIRADKRPFRFKDLPKYIREQANSELENIAIFDAIWELKRCFDLESIEELIRRNSEDNSETKFALESIENNQILWNLDVRIPRSSDATFERDGFSIPAHRVFLSDSKIERSGLVRDDATMFLGQSSSEEPDLDNAIKNLNRLTGDDLKKCTLKCMQLLLESYRKYNQRAYYLPAARSGIMQSHRVIFSSLVSRATRAGLERFQELPTFSGIIADFMKQIILFDQRKSRESGHDMIQKIATELELTLLNGRVHKNSSSAGGYPDFSYQDHGTKNSINMTRVSSMISEITPLILFLQGAVCPGDILIIEEPEAHLHPAAQTQIAITLGRLVRAGVHVVVTTHSDWLLKEVGNLIREGELNKTLKTVEGQVPFPSSLRSDDVGVWLFHGDDLAHGTQVTEVPFDHIEGIDPEEYERVAEELYNRSIDLQNLFEQHKSSD